MYQKLAQVGWRSPDPAFRKVFQEQFSPDAPAEVHQGHDELQHVAMTPAIALRYMPMANEIDIVDLAAREFLARGLDNHQIAAHLDLSEKTVRNMVSGVFAKLGVESRAQAIVRAREAGYGSPPKRE